MGGRGSSSSGRQGKASGLNPSDIVSTTSLVSARETHQAEVDETLQAFQEVFDEYGYVIDDIHIATLKGKGSSVIGYYGDSTIGMNQAFFNKAKLDKAYDDCVDQGFHPSRGSKSGLQAVASHELGHALTDAVAKKAGIDGLDRAATRIVNEARKRTGHRGVVQMASKISGYATHSNAEAIAEAFSDVYCNGKKARKESHAIVDVMNSYLK